MEEIDKAKIFKKWKPIIEKMLPADDQKRIEWLAEYAEMRSKTEQPNLNIPMSEEMQKQYDEMQRQYEENKKILKDFDGPIIPLSIKIAQQTLGIDHIVGGTYTIRKED